MSINVVTLVLLLLKNVFTEELGETSVAQEMQRKGVDLTSSIVTALEASFDVSDVVDSMNQAIAREEFHNQVFEMFSTLDKSLERTQNLTLEGFDEQLLELNLRIKFNLNVNKMNQHSQEVERLHTQYVNILKARDRFENDTLIKFAHKNIDSELVSKIYQVMRGPKTEAERVNGNIGLIEQLAKLIDSAIGKGTSNFACSYSTSPQMTLVEYYETISTIQKQAYAMTVFSYSVLVLFKENDFGYADDLETYSELAASHFQNSKRQLVKAANKNREVIRCNPENHREGDTFLEATKTLQAFIHAGQIGKKYDPLPKSMEMLIEVTTPHSMEICRSNDGSSRDLDYILLKLRVKHFWPWSYHDEIQIFGRERTCSKYKVAQSSDNKNYVHIYMYFSRDKDKADKYFDLRPVSSDTSANKIVTGVRFVKKNKIIRLQIQEGELMQNGRVNQSTVQWKKLDSFTVQMGKLGVDYHTLTETNRSIEFGEFNLNGTEVVTGVRFFLNGGRLKLSVEGRKIDFKTGKVHPDLYWIKKPENSEDEYIYAPARDLPTKMSDEFVSMSSPGQFITFTLSSLKEDAAQSVVPFFDAQAVVSNPIVPLQGIGLFLKGEAGSGGFLTLKIKTFDYVGEMRNSLS